MKNVIVGDMQFKTMCKMWGVDKTLNVLENMGMKATEAQIEVQRVKEAETKAMWKEIVKGMVEDG